MKTKIDCTVMNSDCLEYGIVSSLIYQCHDKQKRMIYDILSRYNEETKLHSIRAALMMQSFLEYISIIDDKNKSYCVIGMLLHDTGKLYIPPEILEKKGKLTEDEMNFIKNHTEYGYDYLKFLGFNEIVLDIARHHHERINGKGYYGFKKDEISEISKIAAIIDVFDAVSHFRCYNKKALTIEEAVNLLMSDEGLDKKYCRSFAKFIMQNQDIL